MNIQVHFEYSGIIHTHESEEMYGGNCVETHHGKSSVSGSNGNKSFKVFFKITKRSGRVEAAKSKTVRLKSSQSTN